MAPAPIDLGPLGLIFAGVLGALIGSFSNVVIYRLPRRESIAFPGSHCPRCNHELSPLELIPILSWLVQRGRCRSCRSPISIRYPIVEGLMALGFVLIWWNWPPHEAGLAFVPLAALFAVLLILAAIDLDTFTLPDVLTLPALAVALLAPLLFPAGTGLPTVANAVAGAGIGAGVLVIINRVGALILRRFRDTGERLWPIGFDQVNVAALAGALAGWQTGALCALLSLVVNLLARRPVRLPEPLVLPLWFGALLLAAAGLTVSPLVAVGGSLAAAGTAAIAGAIYWWFAELTGRVGPEASPSDATGKVEAPALAGDEDDEPVAMGFGDVKLAAVMGAMLGWEKLLLAVFLSFIVGAIGGVTGRLLGGDRVVPFGPYLVVGAFVALFQGDAIIGWYLGLLAI
ncbi:MAG TPA: prepilin peptidase [Trueperaceae bacterium]